VAAGYRVLQKIKTIAILLAVVQIFTAILLALNFIALALILISVNPDLEEERRELATPAIKYLARWALEWRHTKWLWWAAFIVIAGASLGTAAGVYITRDSIQSTEAEAPGHKSGGEGGENTERENEGRIC
jgi:hypothetical protein